MADDFLKKLFNAMAKVKSSMVFVERLQRSIPEINEVLEQAGSQIRVDLQKGDTGYNANRGDVRKDHIFTISDHADPKRISDQKVYIVIHSGDGGTVGAYLKPGREKEFLGWDKADKTLEKILKLVQSAVSEIDGKTVLLERPTQEKKPTKWKPRIITIK